MVIYQLFRWKNNFLQSRRAAANQIDALQQGAPAKSAAAAAGAAAAGCDGSQQQKKKKSGSKSNLTAAKMNSQKKSSVAAVRWSVAPRHCSHRRFVFVKPYETN